MRRISSPNPMMEMYMCMNMMHMHFCMPKTTVSLFCRPVRT